MALLQPKLSLPNKAVIVEGRIHVAEEALLAGPGHHDGLLSTIGDTAHLTALATDDACCLSQGDPDLERLVLPPRRTALLGGRLLRNHRG